MPDESFKLLIDIQAKITSAIKGLRGVRVEAEKVGAATDAVSKHMGVLEHAAATAAGVLIRDMVRGLAQTFTEAVSLGGRVETLQASFDALRKKAGATGLSLEALRKATRGMVSDVDLLQAANQAMSMHLPVDDLDTFYDAVIRVGKAQGLTATQAINDFTVAIGRQQPKILDNFGIILKQTEAYNEYARTLGKATDALTDSEKETAFSTVAIRKLMEQANVLGNNISDVDLATDQFSASLTNLQTSVGGLLSPLGSLAPILQGCIPIMTTISTITIPQLIAKYGLLGTATMAWGAITAATSKLVTASFLGIPIIGWIAAAAIAIGGIIAVMGKWAKSTDRVAQAQEQLAEAQQRCTQATQAHEQALNDVEAATASLEATQKNELQSLSDLESKTQALTDAQQALADTEADVERAENNLGAVLAWLRGEVESVDLATEGLTWTSEEARERFEALGIELQSLQDEFTATASVAQGLQDELGGLNIQQSELRLEQMKLKAAYDAGEVSHSKYHRRSEEIEEALSKLRIQEAELRLELDKTRLSMDDQQEQLDAVQNKATLLKDADDALEGAQTDVAERTDALSSALKELEEVEDAVAKRQEETALAMTVLAEKERDAEQATKDLKAALDRLESKRITVNVAVREQAMRRARAEAFEEEYEREEGLHGLDVVPPAARGFSGTVTRPTVFLAGERGSEDVQITPTRRGSRDEMEIKTRDVEKMTVKRGAGDIRITIMGPLVNVQGGGGDVATAEIVAFVVKEQLQNVVIEASSSQAPETHKKIRTLTSTSRTLTPIKYSSGGGRLPF